MIAERECNKHGNTDSNNSHSHEYTLVKQIGELSINHPAQICAMIKND